MINVYSLLSACLFSCSKIILRSTHRGHVDSYLGLVKFVKSEEVKVRSIDSSLSTVQRELVTNADWKCILAGRVPALHA